MTPFRSDFPIATSPIGNSFQQRLRSSLFESIAVCCLLLLPASHEARAQRMAASPDASADAVGAVGIPNTPTAAGNPPISNTNAYSNGNFGTGPAANSEVGAATSATSTQPSNAQTEREAQANRAPNGNEQRTSVAGRQPGRIANPLNEFQRFVQIATGQVLPVFGESYFDGTVQTFAPVDRVPVPSDYVIGPGDELFIRAWGNIDIDYRATVDRNGQISIPRVGTLSVAGLKAGDIEGHLQNQIGRVFKGFTLNVTLGQLRSIQVFVVGQARQPGTYTVGSLSTLVNAVFASGGPGPNGSMRNVQLRRGNTLVTEFDLYDFVVKGNKAKDVRLLPGDVIVYPAAGPRVAVFGAVDSPAIYELRSEGDTLVDVITRAGGGRVQSDLSTAQLQRLNPGAPGTPRSVVSLDLANSGRMMLRDGDILTIFPAGPQFANAVTLRGNVARPLRYPYTPGMRISNLIPERDALITPEYYLRKNRLVQFAESRRGDVRRADVGDAENSLRNLVDEPNWEYATVERLDPGRISTRLLPFRLGRALDHDASEDLVLQPGDVVTIFGVKDIRGPQGRVNRLVRVEGEVDRPGIYQLQPGETLKGLVERAGGFTPQAYVYGLEFTREETRQRQRESLALAVSRLEALAATQNARSAANRRDDSLLTAGASNASAVVSAATVQAQIARLSRLSPNGRIALELEPTAARLDDLPDVPLEDADHITVPTRPGFVTVVGAVVNNNAFLWKPGRTAGDYIALAGLDEGAELSNTFILRADGTVNHASGSRSWLGFGNGLQRQLMNPGDAVVVPNQLDYESWGTAFVRNLKDFSQIFSQFGLGAAAIKTLRQ